ncbi:MAG: hypothetical protein E6G17_10600 [Actinobacteria bacterium]|nr:MAG: hypothetical protein E6G17_10600 [Actinomycetota bacterium]
MVRRLDLGIHHELRRRHVAHSGSNEGVDNPNVAHEDENGAHQPSSTGNEHDRLMARTRGNKQKDGYEGEPGEGGTGTRQVLRSVTRDVVTAREKDLLRHKRACERRRQQPPAAHKKHESPSPSLPIVTD